MVGTGLFSPLHPLPDVDHGKHRALGLHVKSEEAQHLAA